MVEQDFDRAELVGKHFDLVGLTAANEQSSIWRAALTGQTRHRTQARGLGQQTQLFQRTIKIGKTKIHPHEQCRCGLAFRRQQVSHPRQ